MAANTQGPVGVFRSSPTRLASPIRWIRVVGVSSSYSDGGLQYKPTLSSLSQMSSRIVGNANIHQALDAVGFSSL